MLDLGMRARERPPGWKGTPFRKGPLLSNVPFRSPQLGLAPVAGLLWRWVARLGLPLVVGAGAVAVSGALVKSTVPSLPIDWGRIPGAALMGGGGVAAFYATDLLPKDWKPVGYVVAVVGVTGSIYWLFSGTPTGEGKPPLDLRDPLPELPIHSLQRLLDLEFKSDQPQTGGRFRSSLVTQEYLFEAVNRGTALVNFAAGLHILDEDLRTVYRTPSAERKLFMAPANGKADGTLSHPPLGLFTGGNFAVEVEVFRKPYDAAPALRSPAIAVTYSIVSVW